MPQTPQSNDRRNFLFRSGAAIGGFLVNPTAGVLGLVAATLATKNSDQDEADPAKITLRPLLRSAAPIDGLGRPFGGRIAALSLLEAPQALQKGDASARFVLVAGHDSGPVSLSAFEVAREARGWNHFVGSHCNRTYGVATPVPLDGARLQQDAPLFREQVMAKGLGPVRATLATPWNTVLCAETSPSDGGDPDFGWLVEINPYTGSLIKRLSLGRIFPVAFAYRAEAGQPFVLYILGGASPERRHLFKFVSHQRFDAKHLQANALLLVMGELSVADVDKGEWRALTSGLSAADWVTRLRGLSEAADLPSPLAGVTELRALEGELVLESASGRTILADAEPFSPGGALRIRREPSKPEEKIESPEARAALAVRASSAYFVVEHAGDGSIVYSRERIGG